VCSKQRTRRQAAIPTAIETYGHFIVGVKSRVDWNFLNLFKNKRALIGTE
jgi:hypothetical protein